MYTPAELEQKITVILTESKSPVMGTIQIARRLKIGASDSRSKEYRRVLRALHRLEKKGLVYWWNEPLTGSDWMLKNRDVIHAFPSSGKGICLGEIPF